MWKEQVVNNPTVCCDVESYQRKYFYLGDFAKELINVLPRSPESFTHLLSSCFSTSVRVKVEYLEEMISFITDKVGSQTIEKHLAMADMTKILPLKGRVSVSQEVIAMSDEDGLNLSVLVTRHMFRDYSETPSCVRQQSERDLCKQQGQFVTHYKFADNTVTISTGLDHFETRIERL